MIHTKIVGVSFEGRQEVVNTLKLNQELVLKEEPENKFDPNAVMVLTTENKQIGYLSKDLAVDFSDALQRGNTYKVLVSSLTGEKDQTKGINISITPIDKYCQFGCGKRLNEEEGDHITSESCARCE